jgi:hypothetical protein
MKVRFYLDTGNGWRGEHAEIVYIPDGMTDDEIKEELDFWVSRQIASYWERVKNDD